MGIRYRDIGGDVQPERRSTPPRRRRLNLPALVLALVGTTMGAALWLIGARYSIDGVLVMGNALLSFFGIPLQIAIPPAWTVYLVLLLIPLGYTIIEWLQIPAELNDNGWWVAPPAQWLVWISVFALDALTTWFGLGAIDDSAPLLLHELVANDWSRGGLTAILTMLPEALWFGMLAIFRRAIGSSR
jgi:hypothetical protein